MPRVYRNKIESPEEMEKLIDSYFDECDENQEPYTICGMALSIGLNRRTILNYQKRPEFTHIIEMAKARVEESVERGLMKGYNATGCIFNLKNNFGWEDKSTSVHEGDIKYTKTKILQVVGVGTTSDTNPE